MYWWFIVVAVGPFLRQVNGGCPTPSATITISDIQNAAHASEQIYKDTLLEGKTIPNTNFKVTKRFHRQLKKGGEGIRVIVADSGNTRMIVYRGTDGFEQLLAQASSILGREQRWTVAGTQMQVCKFFYEAYRLASYDLRSYIKNPKKKYILTGHSLGGALASILALDATQLFGGSVWKHPSSSLITFGMPRVGRSSYTDVHDRLISTFRKLRFIHKADPVTKIPPLLTGWRHHSRAVFLGYRLVLHGWGKKRRSINNVTAKSNDTFADEEGDYDIFDEAEIYDPGVDSEDDYPDVNFQHESVRTQLTEGDSLQQKSVLAQATSNRFLQKPKRFIRNKLYWRICDTGESFQCVTEIRYPLPLFSYHDMEKYRKAVTNSASRYYNKNDKLKSSFQDALISNCN